MNLHQITLSAQQLPDIQKLAGKLKSAFSNEHLKPLNKAVKEIKHGQIINEKILSLTRNLKDIKVAELTGDRKKAKYLVNRFINDPQSSIKKLTIEIPQFESQVSMLSYSYNATLEQVNLPLEQGILLHEANPVLRQLKYAVVQQKAQTKLIGNYLVTLARNLSQNRGKLKRRRIKPHYGRDKK